VRYRQFVLPDAEPPLVLGERGEQGAQTTTAAIPATTNINDVLQSSTWTTAGDSIVGHGSTKSSQEFSTRP